LDADTLRYAAMQVLVPVSIPFDEPISSRFVSRVLNNQDFRQQFSNNFMVLVVLMLSFLVTWSKRNRPFSRKKFHCMGCILL